MTRKTVRRMLASGLLTALLLAFSALRAEKEMKGDEGMGKGKGGKMMDHMKDELGLSEDQARQMKALHSENRETNKVLRDKVEADVANLKVLVDKKAADSELTSAIAALKTDHEALQAAEKKHRDAMQKILTPMQQAKMVLQMSEHMKGGMMGGGMHGHGGDEHEGDDKAGQPVDKKGD